MKRNAFWTRAAALLCALGASGSASAAGTVTGAGGVSASLMAYLQESEQVASAIAVCTVMDGDAGTLMHISELDTAARLGIKLLIAVFNDEAHHIHDGRMAWFKSIQDIHHRISETDVLVAMTTEDGIAAHWIYKNRGAASSNAQARAPGRHRQHTLPLLFTPLCSAVCRPFQPSPTVQNQRRYFKMGCSSSIMRSAGKSFSFVQSTPHFAITSAGISALANLR